MISVAAQPSCRYARRTLPLPCADSATGAPTAATAPAAAQRPRKSRRESPMRARLDLRHAAQRFLDLRRGVLVVLKLAGQERLVGAEVEVAVPGEIEQDRALLAFLLGPLGLVDHDPDRVGRLRRRDDALAARELHRRLEGGELRHRGRLDHALVVELADQRRHAVVAQAAGVQRRRDERVAERVHLHQRREPDGVAEIVDVLALGETGARGRLHRDDPHLLVLAGELVGREREGEAGEVRAAAGAADDDVRGGVGALELLLRLLPDDGLVHEDVVQHATERVLRVVAGRRVLDRLADRDAERAGRARVLLEHRLAGLRVGARARHDLRAPGLHHDAPVRLLLIRHLYHGDLAMQAEQLAGERERRAPLAGAGLGADPRDAFRLVVVRLPHRRVGLVAAGRAHALVLVVDVRGRAERFLQTARAIERRGAPQAIDVADLLGNLDPALLADLLLAELRREERRQSLRADRVLRPGMEHRR